MPAGTMLARYELMRPIGTGATGVVYEAMDTALGRRVAIKVRPMPGGAASATRDETRFFREARAAAQIRHAHVVSLFDFGIEGDIAFLVMELVEGETLASLLRREGALGTGRTLEVLLPILLATAELHAQGVVHRDIKPANILLARGNGGSPKLADFGLSRFVAEASTLTELGMTVGTPEYMAPEVVRGSHEASERSDQYALGVVLYECLTGAKPFRGETTYEVMESVIHGPVLPPSAIDASLAKAVDRVVLRAMQREPRRRFESLDALAEALLHHAPGAVAERWKREWEGLSGFRLPSASG